MTISILPAVNATLNGLSAVFLICGFLAIKAGKREVHRGFMLGAVCASVLFLASYLYYHAHAGTTSFREPAWFRPYYLTLLGTHTFLAVVILPLIVVTLTRAFRERFENHKKIARWTFPLWLYVSLTGVLIYFLLYQIYPQQPPVLPAAGNRALQAPATFAN